MLNLVFETHDSQDIACKYENVGPPPTCKKEVICLAQRYTISFYHPVIEVLVYSGCVPSY
jgi:hypothetical protein